MTTDTAADTYVKPTATDRAAVQAQARAAVKLESVTQAYQTAMLLRAAIQQAHKGADPLLSMLLLPLIGDVTKIKNALGQIELALESRE